MRHPVRRHLFAISALVLLATAGAFAEPVVLRADGYLDVEEGRIVSPAVLVVEDGLIAAVNPDRPPSGATTVDLTSRPSREAANRLYQRIGFEQRETNIYRYKL